MSDPKTTANAEAMQDPAQETPGAGAEQPDAGAAPEGTAADGATPEGAGKDAAGDDGAARIAALESEVAELKDRLLRAVADAENTRKRAERDRQDASKYAVTAFARDVLSVGDNMRRAIEALSEEDRAGAPEPVRNLIAGIEMTEREFLSVLERHGVRQINPLGEKFDPNLHQAMYEVADTSKPAGTVVEVAAAGFVIGERLLRPAMVGVSTGGPAGEAGASEGQNATPGSTIDTKA